MYARTPPSKLSSRCTLHVEPSHRTDPKDTERSAAVATGGKLARTASVMLVCARTSSVLPSMVAREGARERETASPQSKLNVDTSSPPAAGVYRTMPV